jgi:hypothetical protein
MCTAGIMGSSEDIPRVFRVHKTDLSKVFLGVTVGNYTLDDFEYIKGGIVYRLDNDTNVVIPDGWI